MKKLLHLHNTPELLGLEAQVAYLRGKFEGAKLMPEQGADHVRQLEGLRGGGFYFQRLANSTRPDGTWRNWWGLGDLWYDKIMEMWVVGVRDFQLDNEPNLQGIPPKTWRWLVETALAHLFTRLPKVVKEGVRLWLAPLAYGPPHWKDVENNWLPEWLKLVPRVYGICTNPYWTNEKNRLDGGFGGAPWRFRELVPGVRQIAAEWGCSRIDTYTPEQKKNITPAMIFDIERHMLLSYRPWLQWAGTLDYLDASCLFIGKESAGWRGFEASDLVLDSIAR